VTVTRTPLWWENGLYQVEWAEPRVSETEFRSYMARRLRGADWSPEWLALGLRAAFKIRVIVRASRSPRDIYTTLFEVASIS
jgi:hypothetical protein